MSKRIAVIRGDGIGPEIVDATLEVLNYLEVPLEYVFIDAGLARWKREGVPISEKDLEIIEKCDAVLKGPIATPVDRKGYRSVNVLLRRFLDLYANIRFFKSNPLSPVKNLDIVFFRENTEGLYSGVELRPLPGITISLRVITEHASRRILLRAFKYAVENSRKKVTVVHKANILRETCGLFLETAEEIARDFPQIEVEYSIVDATAYKLIRNPDNFDVIVTTNMFGDILTDEIAALVGSIGLVPACNLGDKYAMFEAVHGAAFDIAGKGIANPIGLMLSAAYMLRYLGFRREADRLENAIWRVLSLGNVLTPDLGGTSTTRELIREVINFLVSDSGHCL